MIEKTKTAISIRGKDKFFNRKGQHQYFRIWSALFTHLYGDYPASPCLVMYSTIFMLDILLHIHNISHI